MLKIIVLWSISLTLVAVDHEPAGATAQPGEVDALMHFPDERLNAAQSALIVRQRPDAPEIDRIINVPPERAGRMVRACFGGELGSPFHQTILDADDHFARGRCLQNSRICDPAMPAYLALPEDKKVHDILLLDVLDNFWFSEYTCNGSAVEFRSGFVVHFSERGSGTEVEIIELSPRVRLSKTGGTGPFGSPCWDQRWVKASVRDKNELLALIKRCVAEDLTTSASERSASSAATASPAHERTPPPVRSRSPAGIGSSLDLDDLAAMQSADGCWDEASILSARGISLVGDFPASKQQATILACLCFLGEGVDHIRPSHHQAVMAKAIHWLVALQRVDSPMMAQVFVQTYALSKDEALRPQVNTSVAFLRSHRYRIGARTRWGLGGGRFQFTAREQQEMLDGNIPLVTKDPGEAIGATLDTRLATQYIIAVHAGVDAGVMSAEDLNGSREQLIATWEAANPRAATLSDDGASVYPLYCDPKSLAPLNALAAPQILTPLTAPVWLGVADALGQTAMLEHVPLPDRQIPSIMPRTLVHALSDLPGLDPSELWLGCLYGFESSDDRDLTFSRTCLHFIHTHLTPDGPLAQWWGGTPTPSFSRLAGTLYVMLALGVEHHWQVAHDIGPSKIPIKR